MTQVTQSLRGVGVGFKPRHFSELMECPSELSWLEVHAENYMMVHGGTRVQLEALAAHYPISVHGVGLSLAGETPPDDQHIEAFKQLIAWLQPVQISEHLAWSSHQGVYFNDLLPISYDDLNFERICAHIDMVQQAFYAPEHEPMATERLTALAPDDLVNLRLRLAPCVHILTSPWPIFELWEYLSEEAAAPDFDSVGGQTVMIYRHDYTAQVALLTPEQHRFLTFLADQRSIGDAMIEAHLSLSDFDTIFIHLLEHKLIVSQ